MIRNSSGMRALQIVLKNYKNVQSTRFLASAVPLAEEKCPAHESVRPKGKYSSSISYEDAKPLSEVPRPNSYPIIGIGHHFLPGGKYQGKTLPDIHRLIHAEFGDIVFMPGMPGRRDMIAIYDPDDIEMVFRTEGQWPIRRGMETFEYFRNKMRPDVFKGIGGLLTEQGQTWQDIRTKANPIMLQPKTVRMYVTPIDDVASDFVDRIRKLRDSKMEVPADFGNEMNKWAFESVCCFAFNTRVGVLRDLDKNSDPQKFIQSVHDFFKLMFELDVMPSIWKWYKTPKFVKMMVTLDNLTNLTMKYIDEAIKKIEDEKLTNTDTDREPSVLEKLYKIDRHVAVVMALDMLMAGVDTTSGATLSTLYMLAKNPDKQERLRQELMEKLPQKDSKLTPDLMKNMPYLRACLKETMRIKSVAPGNMRVSGQDLVIKGYQIPKGMDIIIATSYLQASKHHYDKADEFKPERWLPIHAEHNITSSKTVHPFIYLPFGFGPRTCIGKRFAELEIETLISRIVRNFQVEWHHGDMKYGNAMLNIPTGDLKFRFVDLEK